MQSYPLIIFAWTLILSCMMACLRLSVINLFHGSKVSRLTMLCCWQLNRFFPPRQLFSLSLILLKAKQDAAAVKIQSGYRGYQARRRVRKIRQERETEVASVKEGCWCVVDLFTFQSISRMPYQMCKPFSVVGPVGMSQNDTVTSFSCS